MAEVLITFSEPIQSRSGDVYIARACAGPADTGMWEGWIEFLPVGGGEPIESGRETTQPNRTDAEYWASGLATVYLEGALERALHPATKVGVPAPEPAAGASPFARHTDSHASGGRKRPEPILGLSKG